MGFMQETNLLLYRKDNGLISLLKVVQRPDKSHVIVKQYSTLYFVDLQEEVVSVGSIKPLHSGTLSNCSFIIEGQMLCGMSDSD